METSPRARGRSTSLDTLDLGSSTDWGTPAFKTARGCLSHYIFRYVLQQPREMYILSYRVWRITLNFTQPCCLKFVPSVCFPSLERAPTSEWWKPHPLVLSLIATRPSPDPACLQPLPVVCTTVFTSEMWQVSNPLFWELRVWGGRSHWEPGFCFGPGHFSASFPGIMISSAS